MQNLANLPFAFKHIALMPDAHTGYGCLGGVMAADNGSPQRGRRISDGICAVKTDLKPDPNIQRRLKEIVRDIEERVPLGFKHHKRNKMNSYAEGL